MSDVIKTAPVVEKVNNIKFNFELSPENYERLKRYYPSYRIRHEIARLALLEMLNRKEGRDKKLQAEKMIRDAKYIQEMHNQGLVKPKQGV